MRCTRPATRCALPPAAGAPRRAPRRTCWWCQCGGRCTRARRPGRPATSRGGSAACAAATRSPSRAPRRPGCGCWWVRAAAWAAPAGKLTPALPAPGRASVLACLLWQECSSTLARAGLLTVVCNSACVVGRGPGSLRMGVVLGAFTLDTKQRTATQAQPQHASCGSAGDHQLAWPALRTADPLGSYLRFERIRIP